MEYVFITGSNRGIGLALIHEYLAKDEVYIFAACRSPEKATVLQTLAKQHPDSLSITPLEVTKAHSIESAFDTIAEQTNHLDIVINNAGIDPPGQDFHEITETLMLEVLHVNTVAPMMISQAAYPLLRKSDSPRLIQISTEMASLENRTYGGNYGYCSSKAALNMMARGMAVDLRKDGIITIALDPGWARTDMGGQHAVITPEESAQGIINVISNLTMQDSGRYLAYDGIEHPW